MRIFKICNFTKNSQTKEILEEKMGVLSEFSEEVSNILSNFPNGSREKKFLTRYISNNGISTMSEMVEFRELAAKNSLGLEGSKEKGEGEILSEKITDIKVYRDWLVDKHKKGLWNKNDVVKLRNLLNRFTSLTMGQSKRIWDIESPVNLYEYVRKEDEFKGNADVSNFKNLSGVSKVFDGTVEGSHIEVLQITEYAAMCEIGESTNWCVARDERAFEDYNNDVYCFFVDGRTVALASIDNKEVKNINDDELTNPKDVKIIYPVIQKLFNIVDEKQYMDDSEMGRLGDLYHWILDFEKNLSNGSLKREDILRIVSNNIKLIWVLSDEQKLKYFGDINIGKSTSTEFIESSGSKELSDLYFLFKVNGYDNGLYKLRNLIFSWILTNENIFNIESRIPSVLRRDEIIVDFVNNLWNSIDNIARTLNISSIGSQYEYSIINSRRYMDRVYDNEELLNDIKLSLTEVLCDVLNFEYHEKVIKLLPSIVHLAYQALDAVNIEAIADVMKGLDDVQLSKLRSSNLSHYYSSILSSMHEDWGKKMGEDVRDKLRDIVINNFSRVLKNDGIFANISTFIMNGFYEHLRREEREKVDEALLLEFRETGLFPNFTYSWNISTPRILESMDKILLGFLKSGKELGDVFTKNAENEYLNGAVKRNHDIRDYIFGDFVSRKHSNDLDSSLLGIFDSFFGNLNISELRALGYGREFWEIFFMRLIEISERMGFRGYIRYFSFIFKNSEFFEDFENFGYYVERVRDFLLHVFNISDWKYSKGVELLEILLWFVNKGDVKVLRLVYSFLLFDAGMTSGSNMVRQEYDREYIINSLKRKINLNQDNA